MPLQSNPSLSKIVVNESIIDKPPNKPTPPVPPRRHHGGSSQSTATMTTTPTVLPSYDLIKLEASCNNNYGGDEVVVDGHHLPQRTTDYNNLQTRDLMTNNNVINHLRHPQQHNNSILPKHLNHNHNQPPIPTPRYKKEVVISLDPLIYFIIFITFFILNVYWSGFLAVFLCDEIFYVFFSCVEKKGVKLRININLLLVLAVILICFGNNFKLVFIFTTTIVIGSNWKLCEWDGFGLDLWDVSQASATFRANITHRFLHEIVEEALIFKKAWTNGSFWSIPTMSISLISTFSSKLWIESIKKSMKSVADNFLNKAPWTRNRKNTNPKPKSKFVSNNEVRYYNKTQMKIDSILSRIFTTRIKMFQLKTDNFSQNGKLSKD